MTKNDQVWRTCLLALPMMAALALPSYAQDAEDQDIVVTARRTAESLQDVPASVSAFTAETLDRVGAVDPSGLQGAVPNLNIVQGRGSGNALNVYIRGVGQPDALQTFDPAVGFYVDDVYHSRIRGTQLELFDVERVEVLRGPQGTLYGKNTIGGAVRVITRRPGQDPHAAASVAFGEYSQLEGRLSASGPINENWAIGASVLMATRDGYVTNPTTGDEYNDRNVGAARIALAWDPTANFSADFAADFSQEQNALQMGQATNTLTTIFGVPLRTLPAVPPEFNYTASATPGLPNSQDLEQGGVSATFSWEVSDALTLKSITAGRRLQYDDYIDIDATTLELGDVFVGVDQDQVSQELQAIYQSDRLTVVGGLYYLRENVSSDQIAFADSFTLGFSPGFTRTISDDLETTSWAAYTNASFALTDRLNLSAGVRYTEEEKTYNRTTSVYLVGTPLPPGAVPTLGTPFAFRGNETWDDVSPMASIDFHATDNILLYGRVARGFKSGGFNGRANSPGEEQPYDPETSLSYEIGAKTDWMDNRLRLNLAVFQNTYEDFQARVGRAVTSPTQPLPAIDFAVLNAGQLDIWGAELEVSYNPIEALLLDAQIGYLNAEYGSFFEQRAAVLPATGFTVLDRSNQTPAFSPEWTARFGAQYRFGFSDGSGVTVGASARFRSEHALAVDNANLTTGARYAGMWQDDYWLYDARLLWENSEGNFTFGIVGRNLTDEVYKTDAQEFSSVGGIRTAYYGAPSTWTATLGWRY
jgi:iron complex outermembrane receptor protein